MGNRTLTGVPGIAVGHAHDPEAVTGCTAVLGPFAGAVEVVGLATGSRELDVLSPFHLVPICDALLLTGGSAFGLGAADGVVRWLEQQGFGFETRHGRIPIVPAAVIYDLGVGRADVRPGPDLGFAAASTASEDPVREGRVGAGTGATVGKLRGDAGLMPGGLGSWVEVPAAGQNERVGALAVVNAFGDVRDGAGRILAGCRSESGEFLDTERAIREGRVAPPGYGAAENTTLGVVATDRPLARRDLQIVARLAAAAIHRRITPAGTSFDGDLVFALSTGAARAGSRGADAGSLDPGALLALGLRAREALERAIERAVTEGPADGRAQGAGESTSRG